MSLTTGAGGVGFASGAITLSTGTASSTTTSISSGGISLSTGGTVVGGSGGAIALSVGGGDTGNGGAVTIAAGDTSSAGVGGSVDLSAGDSTSGTGGSIHAYVGAGVTDGGFYVKKSTVSAPDILKVTSLQLAGSSAAVAFTSTASTIALDSAAEVTITSTTSTTVEGGPLHVNSENFRVSKDGTVDVLYVNVTGSVVDVFGQLELSAEQASILHSSTGSAATLTISSPSLKLTGGNVIFQGSDVIFQGSAVTTTAPTGGAACTAGTLRYDEDAIYFCGTGLVWKKIVLATYP